MMPLALKHVLGQGALMAKPDTQKAYRLVQIHPVVHHFLGAPNMLIASSLLAWVLHQTFSIL